MVGRILISNLFQYNVTRSWYGLLILPDRNTDIGSDIPYQSLLRDQVKQLYLEDLLKLTDVSPNLAFLKLLVVDEIETISLAQSILDSADTNEEFRRRLDLIEAILVSKFPQISTKEILEMLDLKTADIKETRFYQEILQTGLQEGRQLGLQQGKIEGKIEGKKEAAIALVMRLLICRCGILPSNLEHQVRSLPIEQLETLGEALLDFQGVEDLEAWLKAID